ncbi:hypothetical protein Ancab_009198 [Ancistrocladus abbreviatus]
MDSPEMSRSYMKREIDEGIDVKSSRVGDDEEWESNEKRKHKSGKSRKSGNVEENDGWYGSGKRKSYVDRNDLRKRSDGSSRGDSDEDDHDAKKEPRSKQVKKNHEESTLEKLSNWYQDGELESRHDGGDKLGTRGHGRMDESERNFSRKTTSKFSDHESSQSGIKPKEERSQDVEHEKTGDKDSRFSKRMESSREKGHASSEQGRNARRRWDESDAVKKTEESAYVEKTDLRNGKGSDSRHESSRLEISDGKSKGFNSSSDKGKSHSRDERRVDAERTNSRSRTDAVEEENKVGPLPREDRPGREKSEKCREQRTTSHSTVETRDRSFNPEEDASTLAIDKERKEVGQSTRSRTPERSGRRRHESDSIEMQYERSSSLKRKELEKDGFRDDRVKIRDDSWNDRNRDREGSRENWKRRQPNSTDKDGDLVYDRDREWELPRRGRDRMDNERPVGRSGNRKDGRSEAVKASSNFGISTENYDVIEIQPKPLDYGGEALGSGFARRNEVQQSDWKSTTHDEWAHPRDDHQRTGVYGSAATGDNLKQKCINEGALVPDQIAWRDEDGDNQGGKSRGQKGSGRPSGAQSSSSGSQPPYSNQEPSTIGRMGQQGVKGGRIGRGSRIRPTARDNQQVSIQVPLIGSPFGALGMPLPGPMQPLHPSMSPAPGPQVPPGVFIPQFSPPVVWPGPRGIDMSAFSGVSPVPPGPPGQRFPPNLGIPPNPDMYFNPPGPGRAIASNASGPGFSAVTSVGRGQPHDKGSGGWAPPKSAGPLGKAPSRGEQNDYSQNFVDTGLRPQNFIRELELTNVEDYPKLRELIQKKDEIVAKSASPPMYFKCDLHEFVLSPEFFGTKFDVILVDPPWEEYVHRAPGVTDHMEHWTSQEIMDLKIEAIADTPSFIFLWVGDGVGLEEGRKCLKKWGFRRCEDICWVKTNKHTATLALRHDSHTLFQHSKEHCLMGIKGTVRRSTDGHIIHANIDTDVIIAEEPPYGSTAKPDDIYRIIEHFSLGRRRIELFGEDHNIRSGWLTIGKGLSSSNFNAEAYIRNFADKDGKVWQGGGGRNPPPEAPHLVQTTSEIEALRPKSPMKNQQQLQQQQSTSISLTTANSSNKRPAGNSPQNPAAFSLNQEASSDGLVPWASPMEVLRGREFINTGPSDNFFDIYGYNAPPMQPNGEYLEFEPQRSINML